MDYEFQIMRPSDERLKRHDKEKPYYVTFFDMPKTFLVHYTCKILEPPYTNPIMIVDIHKGGSDDQNPSGVCLKYDIVKGTGRDHTEYLDIDIGGWPSFSEAGFNEILSKSRTFVFNGGNLKIEKFQEHAIPAIRSFFLNGGTVVMNGGDCDLINQAFGCSWQNVYRNQYYPDEHFQCVPTNDALLLLGTDTDGRMLVPEEIYIEKASLVQVQKGEAVYIPRPFETKRQFIERNTIIEDSWYDDETQTILKVKFFERYPADLNGLEEILKQEREWEENYRRMINITPVALHLDPNGGGSVARIGDQVNEDTRMRSVLARMMTTDFHQTKQTMKEKTQYRNRYCWPR